MADMIYERFPEIMSSTSAALIRKQKERCIAQADAIICISETTKKDVIETFDLSGTPVEVVHLAASETYDFRPGTLRDNTEPPSFLYVGGRSSYKNFRIILDAWEMWSRRADVTLVVAGPPFSDEESRSLVDRGLSQSVRHVGRPSEPALAEMYRKASGFIYPSRYEGFGIPLVEAMGCGCPVIASDIPSSREIARDCATYFDPEDAKSLLAALDAVLDSPPEALIQRGLRRARDFSWDQTAQQLYRVFTGL